MLILPEEDANSVVETVHMLDYYNYTKCYNLTMNFIKEARDKKSLNVFMRKIHLSFDEKGKLYFILDQDNNNSNDES